MAIGKKITFEGNTYNLGNKDRVAAAAGVERAPVIASVNFISGSFPKEIGGMGDDHASGSFFIADRQLEVQSIQCSTWVSASGASALYVERLQDAEQVGTGDKLLSGSVDLTMTQGVVRGSVDGVSKSTLILNKGNRLGLLISDYGARGGFGTVTVTLKSTDDL